MGDEVKAAIIAGVFALVGYVLITPSLHFWENQPPTISDLIPTPSSPQVYGTHITWTAIASDPNNDPIYYKFQLSGPSTGDHWVDQQNWSQKKEWIWNSVHSDIGTNSIRVLVMDAKHKSSDEGDNLRIFGNYSITTEQLIPANVLSSDYHDMYANEIYLFGVCIARNDSIKEAQNQVPTGITLNATNAGGNTYTYGNISNIKKVPMNVSTSAGAGADLTGDKTFIITPTSPETSKVLTIPDNNPGHNFVIWQWWVEPLEKGSHALFLNVYTVDGKGQQTPLESKTIQINVAVIPAPPTPKPAPAAAAAPAAAPAANVTSAAKAATENVTKAATTAATGAVAGAEAAAKKTVNETANKTAAAVAGAAKNATAPAGKTPGFEGIFAITGLMAVAYLVLGRKQ